MSPTHTAPCLWVSSPPTSGPGTPHPGGPHPGCYVTGPPRSAPAGVTSERPVAAPLLLLPPSSSCSMSGTKPSDSASCTCGVSSPLSIPQATALVSASSPVSSLRHHWPVASRALQFSGSATSVRPVPMWPLQLLVLLPRCGVWDQFVDLSAPSHTPGNERRAHGHHSGALHPCFRRAVLPPPPPGKPLLLSKSSSNVTPFQPPEDSGAPFPTSSWALFRHPGEQLFITLIVLFHLFLPTDTPPPQP